MLYRFTKVWLSVPGGVLGVDPEEINAIIDEYNRGMYKFGTFWDYYTFCTDVVVYGFSSLWNDKNPLMSKIKTIKSGK